MRMNERLRSPVAPVLGIVCVWALYAALRLLGPRAAEEASRTPAGARSEAGSTSREDATARETPKALESDEAAKETETAADVGAPGAPEEATDTPLDADDLALLSLLEEMAKSGKKNDLTALRDFVAEHPEHVLGRAMLTLFLVTAEGLDPSELRRSAEALQKLAPDQGLPDLLLALAASREGRQDEADRLLAVAAGKDLSWLPDFEVSRLMIQRDLQKDMSEMATFSRLFSSSVPTAMALRTVTWEILGRDEPAQDGAGEGGDESKSAQKREPRPEAARALLELGKSVRGSPGFIIHGLVGTAILQRSFAELERAGALTPEDQALRERVQGARDIRGVANVLMDRLDQVLLTRPDLRRSYLRCLGDFGEAAASRRILMESLATDLSR